MALSFVSPCICDSYMAFVSALLLLNICSFVVLLFYHLRRRPEVRFGNVFQIPLATVGSRKRYIGVHPGNDSDELLFREFPLARVFSEPRRQLAEMRAIVQRRLRNILGSPVPTVPDSDEPLAKDVLVRATPLPGWLACQDQAGFGFVAAVT